MDADTLGLVALSAAMAETDVPADVRAHIDACPRCAEGLTALEASLALAREDIEREADAVFTDRRLARQHSAILRRLDPAADRARVLAFPRVSVGARPVRMVARRWVAAAAVVGLLSGLAAGRFLDRHDARSGLGTADIARRTPATPRLGGQARTVAYDSVDDEQFLVELEAALRAPRIEPLTAIDALTPRASDLAAPAR